MDFNLNKFQINLIIILLLLTFILSSLTKIIILQKTVGLLFIFFIPGFLVLLLFYKNINFLERLIYSIIVSISIIIPLTIFLNIILKLEFNQFFNIILFSVITIPLLVKIQTSKIRVKKIEFKFDKLSKIFLFYIILSLLIRIILFLRVGSVIGADVGRYSSISHSIFLKKELTPNLQPYEMITGIFYFPAHFTLPVIVELLGISPIDYITSMTFFFSFLSTLVFYLIMRKFLTKEKAIITFFFYSFLFDIVLNIAILGVFPYAFGTLYFLILCLITLDMYENKKRFFLLTSSFLGLVSFHLYLLFPLIAFVISIFTYEFVNEKSFFVKSRKIIFNYFKASFLTLIFLLPFFILFGKYIPISFSKENVVDLMSFFPEVKRNIPFYEKLFNLLFVANIGLMFSGIFVAGSILFLFLVKNFIKDKKSILVYFFIYLTIQNYVFFENFNLARATTMNWTIYSLGFSFFFTNPVLNTIILPVFYFIPSPSPLYLLNILTPQKQPGIIPWVVWEEHSDAMNFIRENTTEDSIFLIDGAGSGCTGSSADYGERIFPLTSRKLFYFSDYCFAEYNRSEYRKRVDIYRRISIDPDDPIALKDLKEYNVTHVFIGPNHVGFNPELFLSSKNYELIYNEDKFQIFKIK